MTWVYLPGFLWSVVPLLALILMVATFRWKSRVLAQAGDPHLLARLMDARTGRQQWVKGLFLLLGLSLLVVAVAGPQWGQQFQEVHRRGVDVMIAMDVSTSMLAEDVKPNRLTQAKRELSLLINRLEGDRVGLVAFAGTAFLQCPLTLDYGAARSLLDLLAPDLIPRPGTSLTAAIDTALAGFPSNSARHQALVLLTDGEDHSKQLDAAVDRAAKAGLRIFTIGFGNKEGEIIPIRDPNGDVTGYKKDKEGKTVLSKMDEPALRKISAKTGGAYFPATQGEVEITKILEEIGRMEKKDLDSRVFGQGENHFRLPLALAILLLLLEFLWPEVQRHWTRVFRDIRAGRFFVGVILGVLLFPARSEALGRYPRSEELAPLVQKEPGNPETQFNLGLALYIEQSYAAAAEAFEKSASANTHTPTKAAALYNAGNAHYRQGRLEDAIEKYKQALRLVPSDIHAKHNLELAKKLDEKQKEKKKGDGKPKDDKGEEPQPKPGQMSPEDAERLLEALAQQEKEAKEKSDKQKPEAVAGEDW
ncbi:MAG: VWA domain-containing protein [Elusimicrobia bacterium]|jgi:Ca-activated chloride channel family protein|nr:VWA domain-containing protein [Elusimicrobiota bacterium]